MFSPMTAQDFLLAGIDGPWPRSAIGVAATALLGAPVSQLYPSVVSALSLAPAPTLLPQLQLLLQLHDNSVLCFVLAISHPSILAFRAGESGVGELVAKGE